MQGGNKSADPDASAGQAEHEAQSATDTVMQQGVAEQASATQIPDQQVGMSQQVQVPEYGDEQGGTADNDCTVFGTAQQEDMSATGMDSLTHADDYDADRVMLDLDDEMEGLTSAQLAERVMLDLDDEMEGLISAAAAEAAGSIAANGISQRVQEPEYGSVAEVLAKLSEAKVEAAPGQSHADVLKAEQRLEAPRLAEGKDSSALSQPEGIVVELEQHEPTAEEDASQHIQLKHIQDRNAEAALGAEASQDLDAESQIGQPMQPGNGVDSAVVGNDDELAEVVDS